MHRHRADRHRPVPARVVDPAGGDARAEPRLLGRRARRSHQIQYSSYNDNNALITALTTGEAQWGWTFIADYENVYIAQDPEHYHQVAGGGFGVDVLYLNNETKPFNDVAFRQALNMAIDRAHISRARRLGRVAADLERDGLPMPSGEDYLAAEFEGEEYTVDVDGAKALLEDAGYTWDGDALIDPDGEAVAFELPTRPAGTTT